MTRTTTRGCAAIERTLKIASGVSIIAQMFMPAGAPAASRASEIAWTSLTLLIFGITTDDTQLFAAAAISASPHGVESELHRIVISRLP